MQQPSNPPSKDQLTDRFSVETPIPLRLSNRQNEFDRLLEINICGVLTPGGGRSLFSLDSIKKRDRLCVDKNLSQRRLQELSHRLCFDIPREDAGKVL